MNLQKIFKDSYLSNLFLFNSSILSDVTFIVGRDTQQQRIPAHRFVLSVGSAVFDAMFNSTLATRYVFKIICLSCNFLPFSCTHSCLMHLLKLYQNKKSQTFVKIHPFCNRQLIKIQQTFGPSYFVRDLVKKKKINRIS